MPLFDMPLEQLRAYRPQRDEPADFDAFWDGTLAQAREAAGAPLFTRVDSGLSLVTVDDVEFAGGDGDPVRAWLVLPKGDIAGCVVSYLGYSHGRGLPHQHLTWAAAGWANLVMDSRGQGASARAAVGATGDPHGTDHAQSSGMMTKGISSPDTYYYRRLFTDAVLAVDVAAAHDRIDPARIVVAGGSQGGAIAQAVAGLRNDLLAAFIDVPFLSHFSRALDLASTGPYPELVEYLAGQRLDADRVMRTLSYFDGMHFAARATTTARYSVALRDTTCPPSTVFAAYNHWGGEAEIDVWPWNEHEGGMAFQTEIQLDLLRRL
ncbi:cephalosporin-C deacetylase [Stackebrandtia endophytica]|uniref:Cephalosporin-C deacetylase n=1 Tax=Stackebrandtia endophytica TaxID=1496996 RepID=A0A543B417_9ACTN|nr:acetylxylan esterase [Stackebrandtia endophytica]TQL79578.1 cephalosporin-C deacetylase [Stackebrandtia endophytica]